MRRALVVLAVLVVVAGAFTAGALIVRDREGGGGNGKVVESELHCGDGNTARECNYRAEQEIRDRCADEGVGAVKLTVIYETNYTSRSERLSRPQEYARRSSMEDC